MFKWAVVGLASVLAAVVTLAAAQDSYTQYGGTIIGSVGSSYTRYGNTIISNDGRSCTQYGSTAICN